MNGNRNYANLFENNQSKLETASCITKLISIIMLILFLQYKGSPVTGKIIMCSKITKTTLKTDHDKLRTNLHIHKVTSFILKLCNYEHAFVHGVQQEDRCLL